MQGLLGGSAARFSVIELLGIPKNLLGITSYSGLFNGFVACANSGFQRNDLIRFPISSDCYSIELLKRIMPALKCSAFAIVGAAFSNCLADRTEELYPARTHNVGA